MWVSLHDSEPPSQFQTDGTRYVPSNYPALECTDCGVAVINPYTHERFHENHPIIKLIDLTKEN